MPEILFFFMAIAVAASPPFMSGKFAQSLGYKFWPWFFVGCLLPFVSMAIIYFLPDKTKVQKAE